jgi:integrase
MVSLGYDMYGKQIRKTTTYKPPDNVTEGKAEKLATAYAYEFEKQCQGMLNLNENIRFTELVEWYYDQVAPHKLKENTIYNDRRMLDLYVLPHIGNLKLKDITTARIDALFNQLYRSGRTTEKYKLKSPDFIPYGTHRPIARISGVNVNTIKDAIDGKGVLKSTAERLSKALGKRLNEVFVFEEREEKGLEAGSIARIRTALSPIFSTAVKKEIIQKNPVFNATTIKGEEKEKEFLNAEQCKEILKIVDEMTNPQCAKAIKTLLYTGMRVGELTGLHWDEVDFDNGIITVKYNLYRANGEYKLSTPKTKSSARVIALPPQLIELLKEQKEWQEKRKQEVGDRWLERNAVFTVEYGEYMSKSYINLAFKKFLKKHDFPDVHIHDLRHANASLLINMGVPVKVISEHLGHSNTLTTENIYAHIFNETRTKASKAISKALTFEDVSNLTE